jgi:hypothetical protein
MTYADVDDEYELRSLNSVEKADDAPACNGHIAAADDAASMLNLF